METSRDLELVTRLLKGLMMKKNKLYGTEDWLNEDCRITQLVSLAAAS